MTDFLKGLCEACGTKFSQFMQNTIKQIKVKEWIKNLLVMMFMSFVTQFGGKIKAKIDECVSKINKIMQKFEKLMKMLEKLFKALKTFVKACWKIISTVVKLFFTFWVPGIIMWGILFVVLVIVFLSILLGRFGGYMGEVVIDFDKMQEMNQDKDAYTDLLNTAALKESFYDEIANTSFYQTFNLTDLDGSSQDLSSWIVSGLTEVFTGKKVSPEDVAASKKCVSNGTPSCVYSTSNFMRVLNAVGISLPQTDPRGTFSDASRNPAKYLIQAESLGTYSDSFGMTSYFRDYWNREETFQLNSDFLYELNRWVYGTDALPSTEQIVYPEAFVKPVSFVNDFLRIQNDKTSNEYGKPYVYVTQRITLDEIKDVNSQYYGKYEYEGLIKSLPSDIVYDYVIGATNSYKVENSTNSADSVNIGNPSQYVTLVEKIQYEDGTCDYTKTMMKFYWVVNPLFMDAHMGVDIDSTNGTAFITNPDNDIYSNYFYMDEHGSVHRIGNSSEALIGPFMDPIQMYVDKDGFAGDTIVFKKKMNERSSTYRDVVNDNRSYTYKVNNPYIINNAFVTYNTDTSTEIRYFKHIVDYNKTLSLGDDVVKIYAGEVFYYSGEHYLAIMDFNVNQKAMDPYSDGNMLHCVIKVDSCVKVPYVVDFKECTDRGIMLYPGEVLRATGYWKKAPGFHITDSNAFYQLLSGGFVENVETNRNGLSEYYQEALWLNVSSNAIEVNASMFNNIVEDIIEWTGGLFGYQSEELKRYVDFADDNMYPRKHYQLTQIVNEHGEIVASSRNLINKTYLQKKTVRSYYRNSDEYWEKFADFATMDLERANYIGALSDMLGITVTAGGECVHDERANHTAYPYEGLKYCPAGTTDLDNCVEEEGAISERKCSVILYVLGKYPDSDLRNKIYNFIWAENAKLEAPAEAMYHVLTLYEEWLIETGTEGIEWEYKYYSNTDADAAAAASQFLPSFNFLGIKIPTNNSVLAQLFETDKQKYKDTFDAVVELNEERTVSTEYTPIAITSGSSINYGGDFYADTWGWKLVVDASHANGYYLKKVYGETSYELPPYITQTAIKDEVITDQVDNILNQMANQFGGGYKQMTGLLSTLFNNDYAETTYGAINFAYKWKDGVLEYDEAALNDFYTALYLHANDLSKLNGTTSEEEKQDIRNQDEAWNQNVTIYRPVATSLEHGTMQKYENAGRVTYKTEPDDYLAMELKSVRDYGLGSVLSYLEARKVTFMSGIAVSEMYDRDGVYAWIYSYYSDTSKFDYHGLSDKEIAALVATQAELAVAGYYPSTLITDGAKTKLIICPKCRHNLVDGKHCDGKNVFGIACDCDYKVLDIEYPLSHFVKSTIAAEGNGSGLTVDAEGNYENPFGDISEAFLPSDYAAIADGLNELQGTGESILKYHSKRTGKDYWFTVTYAVDVNDVNTKDVTGDLLKQSQAFVLMMKQNPEDPDSQWIRTNINVAIPYVTELGLESYMISFIDQIAEKLNINDYFGQYTDEDARKEANNQFFNPMGYYLAWYDFSQGNLTVSEQILTMLTREDIVKYYDNHTAASLRQIFNIQEACNLCDCAGIQNEGCNCMCHDEFVSFKNLSNVKNKFWTSNRLLEWISDPKTLEWLPFGWGDWLQTNLFNVFDNAGSITTSAIYEQFYEQYGDKVHVIDLLDDSKTSRVYMIEEAVTFLGNFMYTYDTEMLIAGDVYGNESIVSDIVFADRGYFISNYIFTVPVHVTTVVWSTEHTTSRYTIDNYEGMTDEVIAQIYADNPCATDKDQSGWEEFWNAAGNLFSGLFVVDDDFKELNDPHLTTDLAIKDAEGNPYKYCAANFSYKEDTEKKTLKYEWTYKFGSTVKVSDLNYTNAIYIDTVSEVNNVYDYLMKNKTASNGYESTATKLFIGLNVYENINDTSFLWLNANTIDPIFAHKYTAKEHQWEWSGFKQVCALCGEFKSEATGDFCPTRDEDIFNSDMYKWCVKDEDTTCISAAYGDTELHYGEYSREIIAQNGDNFFDTIVKSIAAIPTYIRPDLDLVHNLKNRIGSLAGTNRIRNGKLVSSLGNEWWLIEDEDTRKMVPNVDEDGNINDTGIKKSLDYVKMGATDEKYFELNAQDLKNIYYAICQVYAEDYTNNNYDALNINDRGENNTSAVKFSSKPWGFTWNDVVRGVNQDAFLGDGHIAIEGDTCYMDFYWKKNTIEVKHDWDGWFMEPAKDRHCKNCGMCKADSTSDYCPSSMEGYYYLRGVQQTHYLSIPKSLDDNKMWLTMLVGINFGDRSMYGSPIALETKIYGSYRQIAPVQTGAYFNEEVYEDWTKRMELTDKSSEDKVNYVLTYKAAKKSYLYDYLTNFETYIPLGVMSDADLVNRGADSYQALGNSDTRSYKYVSSYMGQIKKYIDNAGWISIIDNYNYKTPLLSGILSAIIPSYSSNEVDRDLMTEYVAGLIETTIKYAPTLTVDYYNGWGETIERSQDNYNRIEEQLYLSLFATSADGDKDYMDSYRKVTLILEDGTEKEYNMIYLGYGAILQTPHKSDLNSLNDLTTAYIGGKDHEYDASNICKRCNKHKDATTLYCENAFPGFKDVTLTISETHDDRLDMEKSLEYVSVAFGKLLTKYGNVCSATMAYFYGEEYWDAMLKESVIQGKSTGPEWHNDDWEIVQPALQIMRNFNLNNGLLQDDSYVSGLSNNNHEELTIEMLTAEVVDYALSYIADGNERLFLIRNTTSSLGSAVSSIGAKSEETKNMYEILTGNGMTVMFGTEDGDVAFEIKYDELAEMSRKLKVDMGVVMAIIMAESNGNPCSGLGVCIATDEPGKYVMTKLIETRLNGYKTGLLGLPYNKKTQDVYYDKTERDIEQNCKSETYGIDGLWLHQEGDVTKENMCRTKVDTDFKTYSTSTIGRANGLPVMLGFANVNIERVTNKAIESDKEKWEKRYNRIYNSFAGEDGYINKDNRFTNDGKDALIYLLVTLSNLYQENDNALEVLYTYYHSHSDLQKLKNAARDHGYGSNWYAYYCKWTPDSVNLLKKTLEYYNGTINEDTRLEIEYPDKFVFANSDKSGQTVIEKYFSVLYDKYVEEKHFYYDEDDKKCQNTSAGICTVVREGKNDYGSDRCKADFLEMYVADVLEKNGKSISNVAIKNIDLSNQGTVITTQYTFTHATIQPDQCDKVYQYYKGQDDLDGDSTLHNFCTTDKLTVRTDFEVNIDMHFAYDEVTKNNWWNTGIGFIDLIGSIGGTHKEDNEAFVENLCLMSHPYAKELMVSDVVLQTEKWTKYAPSYDSNTKKCHTYAIRDGEAQQLAMKLEYYDTSSVGGVMTNILYLAVSEGVDQNDNAALEAYIRNNIHRVDQPMFKEQTENINVIGVPPPSQTILTQNIETKYENVEVKFTNNEMGSEIGALIGYNGPGVSNPIKDASEAARTLVGDCVFEYEYIDNSLTTRDACATDSSKVVDNGIEYPVIGNSQYQSSDELNGKLWKCLVRPTLIIDYDTAWEIAISGFLVNAYSLFDDTSNYNKYTSNKLGMQNNGVMLFTDNKVTTPLLVDMVMTAAFATEDNFMVTVNDFSLFAFFESQIQKADAPARSWISPIGLNEDTVGVGTTNDYTKNAVWDFPVLFKPQNTPTGKNNIVLIEQYGREPDLLNGGYKQNEGLIIEANRGDNVYAIMPSGALYGQVTNVGYNTILGNFVEITYTMGDDLIINSTTGESYKVSGIKIIYGYLLEENYGGKMPTKYSVINGTNTCIGQVGTSGLSSGNQLYVAMHIKAEQIDLAGETLSQTGWLSVDMEPYFTSKYPSGAFNVYYK